MKALIRKFGINCYEWQSETVILEPFPQGTDEIGRPYTLDGYRYALCMNVPDGDLIENDPRMNTANYELQSHKITDENGYERIVWTAAYIA